MIFLKENKKTLVTPSEFDSILNYYIKRKFLDRTKERKTFGLRRDDEAYPWWTSRTKT